MVEDEGRIDRNYVNIVLTYEPLKNVKKYKF